MPNDREKLLNVMASLESDYKSGKISREKYNYFQSKYQDKLNSIDAQAATRRIRSMQGKPSSDTKRKKRTKKPAKNKKEQEDLVQKYIINPKKGDAKYNKKEKSSMDSGTFKLVLILVLVIGFTVGVAYGVFNFDFDSVSGNEVVAVVQDTAFPEFNEDIIENVTDTSNDTEIEIEDEDIETTTDTSDTSQDSGGSSQGGGSSSDPTPSPDSGGGQSEPSDGGGQSSDGGGSDE
ncbi:endoglucanase [Methanobrevibacter sp.]|uniref:endoglucanase n=1 Tax=Methanobrevibacter sp. TaxID=66852 RepID=UPI00388E16B6